MNVRTPLQQSFYPSLSFTGPRRDSSSLSTRLFSALMGFLVFFMLLAALTSADYTRDQWPDIAVLNQRDRSVIILENGGAHP